VTEAGEQVAALLGVAARGKAVETEAVDQQVRNFSQQRFFLDVTVEFLVDDRDFITSEGAGVLAGFAQRVVVERPAS